MPIKLNGSGSGSVALNAPANTSGGSDISFTLPTADGTSGQVLQTNGSGALSFASASSDNITEGNTSAEVVDTGSNGHFKVTTEGTEALRVDSSRRLLVNSSTARTAGTFGAGQMQIENSAGAYLQIYGNQNGTGGGNIGLWKARGGAVGSTGSVQNGDTFGSIRFGGFDGTNLIDGAVIEAIVDATPGANDMPGRLVFSTTADGASSPTERMRIDNEGRVYINTTTKTSSAYLYTSSSNGYYGWLDRAITSIGSPAAFANSSGTIVGSINTTASATAYNSASDYRLKENVVPLTGAVNRLNQLQVHRFNFIADPDKTVDGFIAHEAQAVVPECVTGTKDEVDADGNPVYQGIDQSKLVPLLTAALQEALAKLETLEAANAALEARLTALEGGAS